MSTITITRNGSLSTYRFTCDRCGKEVTHTSECGGTGYRNNGEGNICYACCGEIDRQAMIDDGKITLYLTLGEGSYKPATKPVSNAFNDRLNASASFHRNHSGHKVSNWPNTLSFPCVVNVGRHNIAGKRYDVYFTGPDGFRWHGVTYGDNTQLCHCKRTKQKG